MSWQLALVLVAALACSSNVVVEDKGGAGGGGGLSGGSVATSGAGASGGGTTGAGASSMGSGGAWCEEIVGQAEYGSICDESGNCGGVSEGGCIGCSLDEGCGDLYHEWVDHPDLSSWVQCRQSCYDQPGTEWGCCFTACDSSFFAVGTAFKALVDCSHCKHCPNDCGLDVDFGKVCAP